MNKIIGKALPGMPWQERPQDCDRPIWRYSENPIIGRTFPSPTAFSTARWCLLRTAMRECSAVTACL